MCNAAVVASERVTRPFTTSFNGHVPFNATGQAMDNSRAEPMLKGDEVVKRMPLLLMLTDSPVPAGTGLRTCNERHLRSRSWLLRRHSTFLGLLFTMP